MWAIFVSSGATRLGQKDNYKCFGVQSYYSPIGHVDVGAQDCVALFLAWMLHQQLPETSAWSASRRSNNICLTDETL